MFNQLHFSAPSVDINITYLAKKVNTRASLWGPFGFKLHELLEAINHIIKSKMLFFLMYKMFL